MRRLDPRRVFTRRDAAEAREAVRGSQLPNEEVAAWTVKNVEERLLADPAVDYDPLPEDADLSTLYRSTEDDATGATRHA